MFDFFIGWTKSNHDNIPTDINPDISSAFDV